MTNAGHALFTNRGAIAARFYSIFVADVFGWNRGAKTAARVNNEWPAIVMEGVSSAKPYPSAAMRERTRFTV
jgi:hypothetical protein